MWFAEFYGDIEMCTLMEKDALIELASDVQAYMARHNTTNLITDSELEIGKIKGWLYSTNPDFKPDRNEDESAETVSAHKQQLRVRIEKHQRGGKTVTVVSGFSGSDAQREALGKLLKQKCGTGGSVKDGLILIQGEMKERLVHLLIELGYKNTR